LSKKKHSTAGHILSRVCPVSFLKEGSMSKPEGFYILKSGKRSNLAFMCSRCAVMYVFGDERPARAFCCNRWVTPTQKSVDELPIVEMAAPWRPTTLRGTAVDFSEGAEESNQQSFA
jgi:hypothetical protein